MVTFTLVSVFLFLVLSGGFAFLSLVCYFVLLIVFSFGHFLLAFFSGSCSFFCFFVFRSLLVLPGRFFFIYFFCRGLFATLFCFFSSSQYL